MTLIVASATPSFTLSVFPTIRIAKPNQMVSYTVTVNDEYGSVQAVTLSAVGLPTGVEAAWGGNPVVPGNASVLTLSVPSSPPFGKHLIQVVGMAGAETVTESIELIIGYPFENCLPVVWK